MEQQKTKRSAPAIALMVVGAITVVVVAIAVLYPLVSGFAHGNIKMKMFGESRVDTTKLKLKRYAYEAYPSWKTAHPDEACPKKLADLNEYTNDSDSNDSWGKPLKMLCGANLPRGVYTLAVISAGADNKEGTEDDLNSWE